MALSTRQIAILEKKKLMELEKLQTDLSVDTSKGIKITQLNRYRSYKGESKNKSEYQQRGEKHGIHICKAGRKGIYNT